jgi:hypothetical protein
MKISTQRRKDEKMIYSFAPSRLCAFALKTHFPRIAFTLCSNFCATGKFGFASASA